MSLHCTHRTFFDTEIDGILLVEMKPLLYVLISTVALQAQTLEPAQDQGKVEFLIGSALIAIAYLLKKRQRA